jgi:hypothetical protein
MICFAAERVYLDEDMPAAPVHGDVAAAPDLADDDDSHRKERRP